MTTVNIKAVMKASTFKLMAINGVVGVGLGELSDKTPCILVMVVEKTDELVQEIPDTLEGHPVTLLETGEFKAL